MRSEFDFIRNIREKYGLTHVGDDCAVLPRDSDTDLLITADLLVEGVDFRLEWTRPEYLGHKALAVSLSDIAAMGGEPRRALLSIAVPDSVWHSEFLDRLYSGWHTIAKRFGVELVGGDISRTEDGVVIDSILMGTVPKGSAVLRSGAAPGDAVFVTGRLGAAAGGLRSLEGRHSVPAASHMSKGELRQLKPEPRVVAGIFLRANEVATSMIDISDGLSSDLHHLCSASGVGARINAPAVPIDTDLIEAFGATVAFDLAMNGGEDFELLFTAPPEKFSLLKAGDFHRIGVVTENAGRVELISGGEVTEITAKGYVHF